MNYFYLVIGIIVVLLSHILEYSARRTFNKQIKDSVQNIRNASEKTGKGGTVGKGRADVQDDTLLNFIIQPFRKVATSYISVKSTTGIREKIDTLLSIVDSEIAESGSYDSLIGSRGLLFNMMHSMNMEREGKYRPRKDIA